MTWIIPLALVLFLALVSPKSVGDQIGLPFLFFIWPLSIIFVAIGIPRAVQERNWWWAFLGIAVVFFPFVLGYILNIILPE